MSSDVCVRVINNLKCDKLFVIQSHELIITED